MLSNRALQQSILQVKQLHIILIQKYTIFEFAEFCWSSEHDGKNCLYWIIILWGIRRTWQTEQKNSWWIQHVIITFCWWVCWLSSLRLNHNVYTILEYSPIISAKGRTVKTSHATLTAEAIHCSGQAPTHHLVFLSNFTMRNSGVLNINEKIQQPGMITWKCKV